MNDSSTLNEAHLAVQYQDPDHQRSTSIAGMWLFLTTEVMFFSGLIACYLIYWYMYPDVWREYSHHLDVTLGTINTVILLTSSLLVALAVHAARAGHMNKVAWLFMGTVAFGIAFLGIKAYEWHHEFTKGLYPGDWTHGDGLVEKGNLYFRLYFALTGLHGFHVIIGVVLLAIISILSWKKKFSDTYNTPIEVTGLYWHFVDVVWIFLFPILYLVDRT